MDDTPKQPEEAAAPVPPTPPAKTAEELCEEYKLGWQRAVADYQNLKRETEARRIEMFAFSELQILEEFIPVYDNFKKAMNFTNLKMNESNSETNGDKQWLNWKQGIEHIKRQFGDILKAHRIEEIKTVGEKFDPKFHETVGEEESGEKHGIIMREVEGGYSMNGRVIKVARVIISK